MTTANLRNAGAPVSILPRGAGVARFAMAGFADAFGSGFFYPFALLFYTRLSKCPLSVVGIVLTLVALGALPSLVGISRVVNRCGPRTVLVAAAMLRAGCFACRRSSCAACS
jgi:uncharacterized membrane protein